MIKYVKYIVLIFGGVGLFAGSFFYMQNKRDIKTALEYKSRIDYDYLKLNCSREREDYLFPCIKKEFEAFLQLVSLTGTGMGLKMVFNVMDEDRARTNFFTSKELKELHFSINYLEINNLALDNAYRRYFGFQGLYGGFIASLKRYYSKGYEFSENIIWGLEGEEGIKKILIAKEKINLEERLDKVKRDFYEIKERAQNFIDEEYIKNSTGEKT